MPDDEETELQKVIKKMDKQLADEITARKELEKELQENKKKVEDLESQLNPPDDEEKPTTDDMVKKMADYIDEEKKTKEARHKRKVEKYRVKTPEEEQKDAAELFHKMLMDAAEEE